MDTSNLKLNAHAVKRSWDGYEFLSYRTGIMASTRYCSELDATYNTKHSASPMYVGTVFGRSLGRTFRHETTIMREIVKRATGKATKDGKGPKLPILRGA